MSDTLATRLSLRLLKELLEQLQTKGSVLRFIPYTMQAVKQGFQDLGASSLKSAHDLLRSESLRLEVCTSDDAINYEKQYSHR